MTGVFVAVKNFVSQSWAFFGNKRQRNQDPGQINANGGGPHLYSVGGAGGGANYSRKRPLERFIHIEKEIQLTDDEDDVVPTSSWKSCSSFYQETSSHSYSKRFKGSEQEGPQDQRTLEEMERDKIITRGTGINPAIPGLVKQPWEFDFRRKDTTPKGEAPLNLGNDNPLPSTSTSTSTSRRPEFDSNFGDGVQTSQSKSSGANKTDYFSNFRFKPPTKDKNIEVITICDDDVPSKSRGSSASTSTALEGGGGREKKSEGIIMKYQPIMKQKTKFLEALKDVGHKIVGRQAVDPISDTIRLEERNLYRDLIGKMRQQPAKLLGKHFQRSKVDVQAIYYNWPNTSPNVSLSFQNRPISDRVQRDLRLFSTPAASRSSGSTPQGPPSPPILVDLEEESKEKSQNQIVSCYETPSTSTSGPRNLSFSTSFADLEDALSSTKYDDSRINETLTEGRSGQELSLNASKSEVDDDITILTESILDNCASRRYNSLALEQNMSPYVNRKWLDDVSSSYLEKKKWRDARIKECLTTVDILNKESTLEKDLREDIRRKLTLTEIIVLEEAPPKLPELTEEMKIIISSAKRPGREDDILAKVFNIDFTRGDVKTLAPCKWLNDNVINAYMELIAQRSKTAGNLPSVYAFTTFFYPKLLKEGYSNPLKRWTRKVDIFENDLIVFPIHLGLHWCLACADLRAKSISYYDSLGGRNDRCLNTLLNYLSQEMKERKGQILNKDDWHLENVDNVPQQQNGSDCGVFTCKFAEYLSREAKLTFLQENMNYYRDRMVYEIIEKDLLYP